MTSSLNRPGLALRALRLVLRMVILAYAVAIVAFIWMIRDLIISMLAQDPMFVGYSIAVGLYVVGRFVGGRFHRSAPDVKYRPAVSVVIPAFNEEEGILGTIESCLNVDYPGHLLEVIVVNDGSTDRTWERILEAKQRWPKLFAIDLGRNYGKRGAMAEGIRRARGHILTFVDPGSYLKADAVTAIVQPFVDHRVGAVVGRASVRNAGVNWITRMQHARYSSAFRVIKGRESLLPGTLTGASGWAAYRTSDILPLLDAWEHQWFPGLASGILAQHRVVYQASARVDTVVPTTLRKFLRGQLRWTRSWLRESLFVVRRFWRKNRRAALFTLASIAFPIMAPFVLLPAFVGRVLEGHASAVWFYLIGTYAMALVYSLLSAFKRQDGVWRLGVTSVLVSMSCLVFQTYWAIVTMRATRRSTRASRVDHPIDRSKVTALTPDEQAPPSSFREFVGVAG